MKGAIVGRRLIDAEALAERIGTLDYLPRRDKELFISEVLAEPTVEIPEPPRKRRKNKKIL